MENRRAVAIFGSVLILVGVFAPLASMPIVGSMSYFRFGRVEGALLVGLAVGSLLAMRAGKYAWLWLTGLGSVGIVVHTYLDFQNQMSTLSGDLTEALGEEYPALPDLVAQSTQLQWGWFPLVAGALSLLVVAALRQKALTPSV